MVTARSIFSLSFFRNLCNRFTSSVPHSHPPLADAPAPSAIVTRSPNWLAPHPSHLIEEAQSLQTALHRHAIAPWAADNLSTLLDNGADAILKQAMLAEPMSAALAMDYHPAHWTPADFQPGHPKTLSPDDHRSRPLAHLLVAAAAISGASDYLDDRNYIAGTVDPSTVSHSPFAFTPRPDAPPELLWRRDRGATDVILRLTALAMSARAARTLAAAGRAVATSLEHGPRRWGDARRIVAALYEPHRPDEDPARLAAAIAWAAYSIVRDALPSDGPVESHQLVEAVLHRHAILTPKEWKRLPALVDALTDIQPQDTQCITPLATVPTKRIEPTRPVFTSDELSLPVVGWDVDDDPTGWVGPLNDVTNLDTMIDTLRAGSRPNINLPPAEAPAARFALSFLSDTGTSGWPLDDERTALLRTAFEDILAVLPNTPVYLFIRAVHELDIPPTPASRVKALEVFAEVPMLFVEKNARADETSLQLWGERQAALVGKGALGHWLPLVSSTDGNIPSTFGRIANAPSLTLLHASNIDEKACERVAALVLRSNLNSKAVNDDSEFPALVDWAARMAPCGSAENGTEQDWMGVADIPPGRLGDALHWPNVLRCGRKSEVVRDVDGTWESKGELTGVLRCNDGQRFCVQYESADDAFATAHSAAPLTAPAEQTLSSKNTFH